MQQHDTYENLFSSFVKGGGLNKNRDQFEDGFDDGADDGADDGVNYQENNGGARGVKKAPKAKKAPKVPKAKKAPKVPKAKKAPKAPKDDEKVVEVDVFTVIQSSVGVTGSTYKSRTPRSAALKAAGALFKSRPSARTLTFTMQKITRHSNMRVYAYKATLEIYDQPEIVVKHDKNGKELRIPITRKVNIKKIDVDEDIRREQKEALKAQRKELRDKEKAKVKKAEKAEKKAEKKPKADKKAKAEKKPKADKKAKADKDMMKALKKAEKEEKKLLEKADKLLTKYSQSMEVDKKKKAPKKPKADKKAKAPKKPKGKGRKDNTFWGGSGCSNGY
jgi:hypothetical protein